MARFASSFALLPLLALGGCMSDGLTPDFNPSISSANQPVVQRTDYVLDLASSGNGVPGTELGRLSAWFDSLSVGYGDRIFVEEPAGYGDPAAREDVARVAGDYGLLLVDGGPVTAGAVQPGSVRVVLSRSIASVPGCPMWEENSIGARISTSPNYGCATNSNLAAMIADPNDLVLGQDGSAGGDAHTATKAVKVYRDRIPTGTKEVKETSTTEGGN